MPNRDEQRSLRERNRERTTDRIVTATADLVRQQGHTGFSMPQVAEASGVALRTLYRYFPTRQALVDALATVADQTAAIGVPTGLDDLERWLTEAWRNLLAEEALIRAQHIGPSGAEIRRSRSRLHRSITMQLFETVRPDLDATARDELASLAMLLTSSTALLEFVDVLGVEVEDASRMAANAVATLVRTY